MAILFLRSCLLGLVAIAIAGSAAARLDDAPPQRQWIGTWKAKYHHHISSTMFDWEATDIEDELDLDLALSIADDGSVTGIATANRLARTWKTELCQGLHGRECVTRCTGEYNVEDKHEQIPIIGSYDKTGHVFKLELQPSSTLTADATLRCQGERPPPPLPIHFDFFNCSTPPSANRHCAVTGRFLRVSAMGRPEADGHLPQGMTLSGFEGHVHLKPARCPLWVPKVADGDEFRDPFGSETPGDIAPNCYLCSEAWELAKVDFGWQTHDEPDVTRPMPRVDRAITALACSNAFTSPLCIALLSAPPPHVVQCEYLYKAIWRCPTNGEVFQTRKAKSEPGSCIPRG